MRRRFVSLHLSRPKGKDRKTVTISMVALQHSRQTQSSNYAISTKQLLPLRVIATGSGREGKRTSHLQIWLSKGKENCQHQEPTRTSILQQFLYSLPRDAQYFQSLSHSDDPSCWRNNNCFSAIGNAEVFIKLFISVFTHFSWNQLTVTKLRM